MGLGKRAAATNLAAMAYPDVPAFFADVNAKENTVGRLALLFTILTAARSGEVRNARWSHIERDTKLWNRPAELMKARTAHTVTLSSAALEILDRAAALNPSEPDKLIFPSSKGVPLSDMTLTKVLRDAEAPYTVHGFRSSFRDWAAEKMPGMHDAAEAALAHVVQNKVERAYMRTKFIEMRRELLEKWGSFVYLAQSAT